MNLVPARRLAASVLLVTLTGTVLAACGGSGSGDGATSPVTVFDVSADPGRIVPAATAGHHAPLTVAALHSALDSLLADHATLIAALMHEVGAGNDHPTDAVNALAANTQGLIDAIDAVYGADGARAFAQLWEQHTQFFIDYSQAARNHDSGAKKAAISRLVDYQNDFASFVTTATGGGVALVAVIGLLHTHVDDLTNYINADVDGRAAAARDLLAQTIAHMHVIAKAIVDAIARQHLKTITP